ncbi:MAG: hypothetical protein KAT25_02050 [Sulfuriflexus sp.]|nr:hypothetical protein [Sulfuriflexus sp.]
MFNKNLMSIFFGYLVVGVAVAYVFIKDDQVDAVANKAVSEEMSLSEARQAYWARDMAKSERLYRIITSTDETNINAWGELGNLYYMQARWQEAARAYAEVALGLIEKDDLQQAAYFHSLVNQMDREQSERINQRLRKLIKS